MIITKDYFETFALDLVAVFILYGMCLIPKTEREKKGDMGTRIFTAMGLCIIFGGATDLMYFLLIGTSYSWSATAVYAARTISEFAVLAFLFSFLLYTDYKLFGSKDHLKRHFGPFLIPLAVIVIMYIVNFFTGFLFDVNSEMKWEPTKAYYVVDVIKYAYLIVPSIHFMRSVFKSERRSFLHPLSIYVPIVSSALITALSPFDVTYLGFAVGLVFLVFSRIDSWRYADRRTSFYNKVYLEYIRRMIEEKNESRRSMIVFEAKGNQAAFADLLKEELPADNEKVSLGKGRVVFISDTGSAEQLNSLAALVKDGAEEYDSTHSDKILLSQSIYRIFKDDEDALAAIKALQA